MIIQTKTATIALANGLNSDINAAAQSLYRITGPTGAFSIDGINKGKDGAVLILFNTTGQTMTIVDTGTSVSKPFNQIALNGTACVTTGPGVVTLIYDATSAKWILLAFQS